MRPGIIHFPFASTMFAPAGTATFAEAPIAWIFPSWTTIVPPKIGGLSTGRSVALIHAVIWDGFFDSSLFGAVCFAKIDRQKTDPDRAALEDTRNFLRVFKGWILELNWVVLKGAAPKPHGSRNDYTETELRSASSATKVGQSMLSSAVIWSTFLSICKL